MAQNTFLKTVLISITNVKNLLNNIVLRKKSSKR